MIQPVFSGMMAILLAKFVLNDVPHALDNNARRQLEEAIAKLGGAKPAYQWFEEAGKDFPGHFYHLTTSNRVNSILKSGLSAPTSAQFSPSMRYGVYLFSNEGDMDVFYDAITYEMYKGQRVWTDLAVIEVSIPASWPLVIDPEYVEDPENPFAFISSKPIPASMVVLKERRPVSEAKRWYEEHKPD